MNTQNAPTEEGIDVKRLVRPSLKPQGIDEDTWYYEYKVHIDLVHWVTHPDGTSTSVLVKIPWRKLEKSLSRCRANGKIESSAVAD